MADATIRAFCAQQRELLELELQSEQDESEAITATAAASSSSSAFEDARRSHVLHQLAAPDVSLGLYGRTVVRLEPVTPGALLPAHRFTTGDQVEIRSKSSSSSSATTSDPRGCPGGVVNEVTDQSISVALFSSSNRNTNRSKKKGEKKQATEKNNADDDDDDALLLGSPPYSLLPKSSIEVHKKLMAALDELEKKGIDHPVAGTVVRALFDPPCISDATAEKGNSTSAATAAAPLKSTFNNTLDESQRAAIAFALDRARPVALIHGPPGSGKTSSVVETIQQAIHSYGYSKILVTAPSNVAVDNVLARLMAKPPQPSKQNGSSSSSSSKRGSSSSSSRQQKQLRVVRLGHPARLQANILPYSLEALVHGSEETQIVADVRRELEQLVKQQQRGSSRRSLPVVIKREISALRKEVRVREEKVVTSLLTNAQVILATCVGAGNSRLLRDLDFDLVVIDEAAQSLEAACWIPALQGRKLILAGDHCQLPPTIKSNSRTVQEGLGTTMFERLMHLYGDDGKDKAASSNGRVSRMLQVQYRMNQRIADWASQALYGGALRTHASVKDRTLGQLDGIAANDSDDDNADITESPLLLIDTAGCDMFESTNAAGSRFNEGEAQLVGQHVRRLLDMGVQQNQIAIITPYNGQVEILRTALLPNAPKLEIRSVDGFQGGEREAVVLSLVRSSDRGGMSGIGFLRDDRRLNVAVTRAKRHCCVICDSETVSQSAFVKNLVSWMEEHGEQRSALEYMSQDNNNEGQIESDLAQAQIEMEKLMSQVSEDATKTEDKKKAAQNKTTGLDDEKRTALLEKIKTFAITGKPGAQMQLSTELSKGDRKAVHELAEELGVCHNSAGVEGVNRRITISIPPAKVETETHSSSPTPALTAQEPSAALEAKEEDNELARDEEEEQKPAPSFAALVEDDESDDEVPNDDHTKKEQESKTDPSTEDPSPVMNNVLGSLAKERAQRQAQQRREASAAAKAASTQNKKNNSKKKKKGHKLGGTRKPPPKQKDARTKEDDADLDDMAFLDAQIDKVQNSHGRTFEGKGSYRTVMNGILISKPAPVEKKRDARASAALQSKLKQAQSDRKAKGKKKK